MGPPRMEGNTAAKRRGSRRDGAEGCAGIEVRPLIANQPGVDPSKRCFSSLQGREVARQAMAFYLPLTNYRNNWKRLGFSDEDLDNGGSNNFLDGMVAWGTETAINHRI